MSQQTLSFDLLINRAHQVIEEHSKQQAEQLAMLLGNASEKAPNEAFSPQAFIDELMSDIQDLDDKIELEHRNWIAEQAAKERRLFEQPMLQYFSENLPDQGETLYYEKWRYIKKTLEQFSRITEKFSDVSYHVVAEVEYAKTPYTEQGFLPLILVKRVGGGDIYIIPKDPLFDSYFVIADTACKSPEQFKPFVSKESLRPSFVLKTIAALPDKLQSKNILQIGSDIDLHGFLVTALH